MLPRTSKRPNSEAKSSYKSLVHFRWQKLLAKINFTPPSDSYYENLPVKPGFMFWVNLITAPRASVNSLKLSIPDTILHADKVYWLETQANGYIHCTDDVNFYAFLRKTEAQRDKLTGPLSIAAGIMRGRGEREDCMQRIVLDWALFRSKMTGREVRPYNMIQQFVRSPGGKPAVLRLFYNRSTRDTAASYAYQIVSLRGEMYDETEMSKKCTVDYTVPGGVEITKATGVALRPLVEAAESLSMHLNRGFNVRIEKIVLDFLKDDTGRLYFSGCKGLILDIATIPQAVRSALSPRTPVASSVTRLSQREVAEERKNGSFVRCKLCRMHYTNDALSHSVSLRMLLLFKMHAAKRVDLPLDTSHLKITTSDLLSQTLRVCPYCYVMVTSEFMLVELEKDFAAALNIPYKEEELEEDEKLAIQLQFLPKTFVQWRLLIHMHELNGFRVGGENLSLYVKLHSYRTRFPIEDRSEDTAALNVLKGMYFFARPNKSVRKFLSEFRAEFTVESDTEILLTASSPILLDFPSSLSTHNALIAKKTITLFSPSTAEHCDLVATIGISCDHICESKYIKAELAKVLDVYVPEEHYCNSDPLPQQWMEHFGQEPVEVSFEEEHYNANNYYFPTLTTQEVKRMQGLESPFPPPLTGLTNAHPSQVSKCSVSMPRFSAVRSKDSCDLAGLETNSSVKELFSTVNAFLSTRGDSDPPPPSLPKAMRKSYGVMPRLRPLNHS